ncbi:uncharacterized protein LOC126365882 [Schistocerca gregaria]|uniref:uncharacterized protein LOC126365882 n=1 Tax=Schistocerca gregaria TaxID=7010 RepID=UPI00211E7637|nr:uncharacterized protein LOC126365882 [Schistocerca gregaria]XP_049864538.1 uncharacterized protein LOC126365882 [Schistocerca gregaria]XP_049864539.1 uncharacterized protein LOC126365882 [Schistocerca gregaria]
MSDGELNLERIFLKYSAKQLGDTLEAVRPPRSLSSNKASAEHNVPKAILSTKLSSKTIEGMKMVPQIQCLTTQEEQLLKDCILGKAKIGFQILADELKDAVHKFLMDTGRKNTFTNNWRGLRNI